MFNAQSLFSAALIAATTVTTVWGKAQAVLYFTDDCISSHSSTIGMSTGVCHSTFFAIVNPGGASAAGNRLAPRSASSSNFRALLHIVLFDSEHSVHMRNFGDAMAMLNRFKKGEESELLTTYLGRKATCHLGGGGSYLGVGLCVAEMNLLNCEGAEWLRGDTIFDRGSIRKEAADDINANANGDAAQRQRLKKRKAKQRIEAMFAMVAQKVTELDSKFA
ncbi:hypothetical protein B0H14DRAFT_2561366 [Mycena olivaceomarginata]|nr:hypothetical protein B0H14DRAFT_2561366 [Mycena olivaceomarginata]